eukprot:tig00000808_g4400.t1
MLCVIQPGDFTKEYIALARVCRRWRDVISATHNSNMTMALLEDWGVREPRRGGRGCRNVEPALRRWGGQVGCAVVGVFSLKRGPDIAGLLAGLPTLRRLHLSLNLIIAAGPRHELRIEHERLAVCTLDWSSGLEPIPESGPAGPAANRTPKRCPIRRFHFRTPALFKLQCPITEPASWREAFQGCPNLRKLYLTGEGTDAYGTSLQIDAEAVGALAAACRGLQDLDMPGPVPQEAYGALLTRLPALRFLELCACADPASSLSYLASRFPERPLDGLQLFGMALTNEDQDAPVMPPGPPGAGPTGPEWVSGEFRTVLDAWGPRMKFLGVICVAGDDREAAAIGSAVASLPSLEWLRVQFAREATCGEKGELLARVLAAAPASLRKLELYNATCTPSDTEEPPRSSHCSCLTNCVGELVSKRGLPVLRRLRKLRIRICRWKPGLLGRLVAGLGRGAALEVLDVAEGWDLAPRDLEAALAARPASLRKLAYSHDGRLLATRAASAAFAALRARFPAVKLDPSYDRVLTVPLRAPPR